MNADEILKKFYALADQNPNEANAALVRQLGELFYARLHHTTEMFNQVQVDFQGLSTLVIERLKNNERSQADKIDQIIGRIHGLSNHIMGIENKIDELAELVMQYYKPADERPTS